MKIALSKLFFITIISLFFHLNNCAIAQENWPTRPITMVIPFPPGGVADTVGRPVAEALSRALGQPVIVENRSGAGGGVGMAAVARAKPDGYTILMTSSSIHSIGAALNKKAPFDYDKDFTPIVHVASAPHILLVTKQIPVNNLKELIAFAKANPTTLNFSSAGNGTIMHLTGESFKSTVGIQMQHIPYKGVAPAINDVLGGQVPLAFASLPSALNYIKAGKLQAIAISSAKRSSAAPEIPTIAETYPDCVGEVWVAIFAPMGVNADVVKKVQMAMEKVMSRQDVREKLIAQGLDLSPVPSAKLPSLLKEELAKWVKIVKASGAQLD